ncbi:MAG: Phosphoesterase PA-phosphatase related [Actinobacteria bacterium 66_15]|nr:MAG: Phosphoesterase PA-phosphatase related [Actinobacteria bacterium 66_15]
MTVLRSRGESWQRDPRPGASVIAAGGLLLAFVALGVALVFAPAFIRFDAAVSEAIRSVTWPWVESVARAATWLGDFWPMAALTAGAGAALWVMGRRTSSATLVLTVALGSLLGSILKLLFGRLRPAEVARIALPESYSFPSGHALSSLLFFGSVAFLIVLHVRSLRVSASAVLRSSPSAWGASISASTSWATSSDRGCSALGCSP